MKLTAIAGAVLASFRVRIRPNMSSFHEKMNEKIAETAIPGAASGRQIERMIRNCEAPSRRAAWSRS